MQIITQGDRAVLQFQLLDGPDDPHDLSGASYETKIMGSDDAVDTFDNSHHSTPYSDQGRMTLTLTPAETAALKVGLREVVTKVTQASNPIHFRSWCLTVKPATPEG